jgi:hypothetical protein
MANWKFFLDGNEVEEPIGWDAIEFTAIRMDSHGIDQPFSTEVKFYAEGARYIKSIYDQYFINQPIAITITSDVGYGNAPYQFDGFLNLAIYEEVNVCDTDSWEITVGIIDDDFREQFKARQEVDIDLATNIDLNGDTIADITLKNIRLHTQDLFLSAQATNLSTTEFRLYISDPDDACPFQRSPFVLPHYWDNSDFKGQYGSTINPTGVFGQPTNVIFVNNTSQTRTFDWKGSFDVDLYFNTCIVGCVNWYEFAITIQARIAIYNPGQPSYSNPVATYNLGGINGFCQDDLNWQLNYSETITLAPDQRAVVQIEWLNPIINSFSGCCDDWINLWVDIDLNSCCLNVTETNQSEFASQLDCLTIEQALNRIIYKLTGSNNKLLSDTFSEAGDGCYWNNVLTTGLYIRNAPTIEQLTDGCGNVTEGTYKSIKTTWKDVFEGLDKIFCLGWAFEWTGTEWKIRVETRDYFYQNIVSQTFRNVGNVSQAAKVDMLANNIIVGFDEKWKNIAISGIWAIHTERNYFVANKAMNEGSSAKLDLRSNIIAEGYAIEFSRRLQDIKDDSGSSDRPNDYELFIIWLNRYELTIPDITESEYLFPEETGSITFSPGTVSMSSTYITASNTLLDHLYNIYHTPARIACRWWKVLGMHTYGLVNPILRFTAGEYQVTYSSTINGSDEKDSCIEITNGAIAENSNISAAILKDEYKDYLFRPIEVTFSYPQSLCDFLTLSQDEQYKKVRLTSGSLVIEGFITSATNQPEDASGGTTQFTLLYSNLQSELGGAFDEGFDDGYDNGG